MYLTRLHYNKKLHYYTLADVQNENNFTMPETPVIADENGTVRAECAGRVFLEKVGKVYILHGNFYAETENIEAAFS